MVLLLKTIRELRSQIAIHRQKQQCQVGLVPTMGAFHQGHLSLIKRASAENNFVIVSIFVNPLQFTPTEDLAQYPRQLQQDLELCQKLGVDLVFAPENQEMNSSGDTTSLDDNTSVIPPQNMTDVLCGKFRPGHFTGVATIVTKLLNILQPDRAYFGQKDAQQLAIIRRLVADLNIPVKIVACPIIRETSGLALSSRNQYLTAREKEDAAQIYRSLQQAATAFNQGKLEAKVLIDLVKEKLSPVAGVTIQYVELVDPNTLQPLEQIKDAGLLAIAAYVGSTRLIDNIVLQKRQPIVAIDGPAGAGKSTVTRRVAHQLGLLYLDTGAMYRAVTWLVMESNIAIDNHEAIANLIKNVSLELTSPTAFDLPTIVYIDDREVTNAIRTPEVTANVSAIAAQAAVRQKLVEMQQQWGEKGGIIAEGRDIGTNVFPNAELKIFLTASAAERARRRLQDLQNQGRNDIDLQQLTQDIQQRDEQDSNRAIAPLKKADDAIELITDNLTIDEVIAKIINLYNQIK
ncbi:bifunctional pantoate--beta-alanine ligase/(d)CMP kinase [Pleurocapsa sp. PCC 7319]|uniref:bifunctional pantoate--beta-alanine ligase/(d)CMP kinase n=1 Tax=Pleurocapsa sp. PCC 7319 TaxID=118161 RepID=UPI0003460F5C|nr:bifunctional pantoate--beta-alanine ligase/(d)CMP kinase [Pleurocapsa sp. PCC 7319]